jgi:hypothetical protein
MENTPSIQQEIAEIEKLNPKDGKVLDSISRLSDLKKREETERKMVEDLK